MTRIAAEQTESMKLLIDQYTKPGNVFEGDDDLRRAYAVAHVALADFTKKMRDAEDSHEFTPVGLAAKRKTLRDPLVVTAESLEQRAQVLERGIVKTAEDAWAAEMAPPPGINPVVDALQVMDLRRQLEALPDIEQQTELTRDDEIGRLARRAVYGWPGLKRLGMRETERRVRAEVTQRRADLGGISFRALEYKNLARRYRLASGLEPAPIGLG